MRLTILILILLIANVSFAETFTVTSNADSGPGTLREAIKMAEANGTTDEDFIFFNLPGVDRESRKITVYTSLPVLTSNLTIDGTTQPGVPFASNGTNVDIYADFEETFQNLFLAQNANHIRIYGLRMTEYYLKSSTAFQFINLSDFVFGAPGKGNIVGGFRLGLLCKGYTAASHDVVIQSNFFGTDETGNNFDEANPLQGAINLMDVMNLTIGGSNPNEPNVICAQTGSLGVSFSQFGTRCFLKVIKNKINTDITGTKKMDFGTQGLVGLGGYNDGYATPGGTTDVRLELIDNVIGTYVILEKLRDTFFVKGNRFGIGSDDVTNISGNGTSTLIIQYCNQGIIGGEKEDDKNYFTNSFVGINQWYTGNTTITRNVFRCNTTWGIHFETWANTQIIPFINVTSVSSTSISGTSVPNAKLELFYNDDCGTVCEGKSYITTIESDANGRWSYTGTNCTNIVATATDTYGATSEFSRSIYDATNALLRNATCGKANGSIINMEIVSGTSWHWENDKGETVSNDLNLVGVPAGKYRLVVSVGDNSCAVNSTLYIISDLSLPESSPNVSITGIGCGQASGILSTAEITGFDAIWLNTNGNVVGSGFLVDNLAVDKYTLKLSSATDASCTRSYGPYEIKSDIANTLNAAGVSITNATCDYSDGTIRGLKYSSSITADTYLEWKDESGQLWKVGTLDLINVPSGKYQLKLKDPANCDTLVTPFYTIANQGYIITETSGMQISGSNKCGHPYGSITGIKATNAETFEWTNNDGVVIGSTLDIGNLLPGVYRVLIGNRYGCTSTAIGAVVPVVPNPDLTTTRADTKQGFCGVSNGYIHPLGIQHADQYSFSWTDVLSPDVVVSQTLHLDNILSGNFNLYATDKDGCEESLGQFELTSLPPPVINEQGKAIVDAMCGDSSGLITGLTISGGVAPFSEIWKDVSGSVISTNGKAENLAPNTYHLELEDANGCKTSSSEFVVENGVMNYLPPVYPDLIIPRGTAATLVTTNPQSGRYSLFTDASSSVPLQQNETGTFTTGFLTEDKSFYVTVTRGSCAGNNTIVHVKVADATIVSVPSAFTPNSDGLNDVIKPVVQGLFALEDFSVYDRFGHRVFRTTDINKGWKGDKNGLRLDTGTYIWIIKGKDINNKPLLQKGTIVLIH